MEFGEQGLVAIPSNRVKDSYPCPLAPAGGAAFRGQKRGSHPPHPPYPGGHFAKFPLLPMIPYGCRCGDDCTPT